jgi:anti-anti-sigma factor
VDAFSRAIINSRAVGPVAVFDIEGDFSVTTSPLPTLHELIKEATAKGVRQVLLNFDKAGFVDSFGIGQMIASYKSLQSLGGMLKLCAVPSKLLALLVITGIVPRVLSAYPTEEAALEAFAERPAA